jgi:hypothetical protein
MNERIKELAQQSADGMLSYDAEGEWRLNQKEAEKFAELIVRQCADICLEMAAKCAGISDGALAKDCAYWIKKDFGVEE